MLDSLLGGWQKWCMNHQCPFHLCMAFRHLDHPSLGSARQVGCPIQWWPELPLLLWRCVTEALSYLWYSFVFPVGSFNNLFLASSGLILYPLGMGAIRVREQSHHRVHARRYRYFLTSIFELYFPGKHSTSPTYRAGGTEFLCSALGKLPACRSVSSSSSLCSFFLPVVCICHQRAGSKSWFQRRQWEVYDVSSASTRFLLAESQDPTEQGLKLGSSASVKKWVIVISALWLLLCGKCNVPTDPILFLPPESTQKWGNCITLISMLHIPWVSAWLPRHGAQRDVFTFVIAFVVSLEVGLVFNICLYNGALIWRLLAAIVIHVINDVKILKIYLSEDFIQLMKRIKYIIICPCSFWPKKKSNVSIKPLLVRLL